jgi:two-component system sensor histidine kinase HydH
VTSRPLHPSNPKGRPATRPRFGYSSESAAARTAAAWDHTVEKPLAFEELQRELLDRIYRFLMQLRFVIAPLPLIIGGIVIFLDNALWRRIAIGTAFPLVVTLSIIEDFRVRRQGIPDLKRVALAVGGVLQPVVLMATGGVLSPVILAMLLIDFVASTLLERRISRLLVAMQVSAIVGVALLEYSQIIGSLLPLPFRAKTGFTPSPALLLVWVAVASLVFIVTRAMGCRIQSAFADLLLRTTRARDESLRMHQEQMSDLTLLSGEIAHELKNPLASIKGLAALLSRRSPGEESEPLTVLRREVDRMQSILEGFLNFSRPLVPLNSAPVDLFAIASEVCVLHEGMSELRGVQVELDAQGPIEVFCDPRKVRQILVNLFQNALDAAAARGHISIHLDAEGGLARVAISDDGVGLDPELAQRVFEAGVTNKVGGSGLGLNVARGLARQHGGDVVLVNRPGGCCTATLTLPLHPAQLESASNAEGVQSKEPTREKRLLSP